MKPKQQICSDCKRVKPVTEFYLYRGKRRARCLDCDRVAARISNASRLPERAAYKRARRAAGLGDSA